MLASTRLEAPPEAPPDALTGALQTVAGSWCSLTILFNSSQLPMPGPETNTIGTSNKGQPQGLPRHRQRRDTLNERNYQ